MLLQLFYKCKKEEYPLAEYTRVQGYCEHLIILKGYSRF